MVKAINVLYVYGDKLRYGGIENCMMNYFRHIDSRVIHIDFAVQGKEIGAFENEILLKGSRIYRLPKPSMEPIGYVTKMKTIFLSGEYSIVHSHCDAMNSRVLRIAKKCNIPIRISHSHNTEHVLRSNSIMRTAFYELSRKSVTKYATVCYACSREAGLWLYGHHPFEIIPNAVDISKFQFNIEMRNKLRTQFEIGEEAIVLGHVGRFDVQKNQKFLIKVLLALQSLEKKYVLLLIGDGWMRSSIMNFARTLGVDESVIFTGEVEDPQDYYNMMDLYLMPSLFEGYGIALEEAEINGLPCIASNFVPQEANVLNRIKYLDLKVELWCQEISKYRYPNDYKRFTGAAKEFKRLGYDIQDAAYRLQEKYINLYLQAMNDHE